MQQNPATNPPTVLYVEDDPPSQKLMRMFLEKRMAISKITILEHSRDFHEELSKLDPKPSVVFLDIHIQPHNGFEMLKILRQFDWAAKIPVIALTASVMNSEITQLRAAGFNGCIAKPLDLKTLPDTLKQILTGEPMWRVPT